MRFSVIILWPLPFPGVSAKILFTVGQQLLPCQVLDPQARRGKQAFRAWPLSPPHREETQTLICFALGLHLAVLRGTYVVWGTEFQPCIRQGPYSLDHTLVLKPNLEIRMLLGPEGELALLALQRAAWVPRSCIILQATRSDP